MKVGEFEGVDDIPKAKELLMRVVDGNVETLYVQRRR